MLFKKFDQFCRGNVYTYRVYRMMWSIKNLILHGRMQPRKYIVSKEKKVVYFINSKVATSSIKAAMYSGETKDDYTIHTVTSVSGMRKKKLDKEESGYFKFTFVRNPFERLVSCYESKYHTDRERFKMKILEYDTYLCGYLSKDKGFDNFVRRVVRIPYRCMEGHTQIQYYIIYGKNGKKLVDYVGRYENLEKDFKNIQEKYDLKPLPHYNNSGGEKRDWKSYYTLETAELVHKKYKKDFEYFEYEDSYRDLIAYLKDRENK